MTQKPNRLQAAEQAAKAAEDKARAARKKLQELRKKQDREARAEARKNRNKALFQVGGLVEIAGLLDADKGALLGGLIAIAETIQQGPASPRFEQWKQRGDALLAKRENTQKKPAAVTETTGSMETTETQNTADPA